MWCDVKRLYIGHCPTLPKGRKSVLPVRHTAGASSWRLGQKDAAKRPLRSIAGGPFHVVLAIRPPPLRDCAYAQDRRYASSNDDMRLSIASTRLEIARPYLWPSLPLQGQRLLLQERRGSWLPALLSVSCQTRRENGPSISPPTPLEVGAGAHDARPCAPYAIRRPL
jgi:hypothetical protein